MPHYQAYGLRIESAFELPELSPAASASTADITLRKKRIELDDPGTSGVGLRYPGVASLVLRDGRTADIDVHDGVDPRVVRLILLGPVLALLLHQRGFLVLHASAVEIGSMAVAFIGDKGAGKSTTAAAFNSAGYALLADDVVAVAPESHLVYPGFPQVKLWREAAEHLSGDAASLQRLHPVIDKLGLRVENRFAHSPRPLGRVYALAEGAGIEIQKLPAQQTFMELVKHSYTLSLVQSTGSAESHFRQAVALAARTPVQRLVRPRSLPSLPELVAAVVADAR